MTRSKKALYYDVAERMFVREQRTLVEIAARCKIHVNTAQKWHKDGAWDRKRKEFQGSQLGYIERLEKLRAEALQAYELDDSAANMDKLCKLDGMVQRANKPIDIRAATVEVMDRYATYIKRAYPELVEPTALALRGFFEEIERVA
jgi:hypothetical protein